MLLWKLSFTLSQQWFQRKIHNREEKKNETCLNHLSDETDLYNTENQLQGSQAINTVALDQL